jgi:HEAT repeat protein
LETSLKDAVAAAHLQLAALDKPDPELLKDVSSTDARVREFAIRILSDRKNPGVADALLEQLKGDDPDQIRRAMGALVELKERRAVPPLIDLARGKDLGFLREILFALGEIGGEEAEAYLYTVSEGHDQPAIRQAARQALDDLSSHGSRAGRERRSEGAPGEEILP